MCYAYAVLVVGIHVQIEGFAEGRSIFRIYVGPEKTLERFSDCNKKVHSVCREDIHEHLLMFEHARRGNRWDCRWPLGGSAFLEGVRIGNYNIDILTITAAGIM